MINIRDDSNGEIIKGYKIIEAAVLSEMGKLEILLKKIKILFPLISI